MSRNQNRSLTGNRSKKISRSMIRDQTIRRDDPAQSRTFIEKAREIGADEDHSEADQLLGSLAKLKPEKHKPKA